MKRFEAEVGPGTPARADAYISSTLGLMSRSQLKSLGAVIKVNGKDVKLSRELKQGDRIEVRWDERPEISLDPEDIPLKIVFENDDVIVVDKPQGMVTHPANGNWSGTLVNAVLGHARKTNQILRFEPEEGVKPDQAQKREYSAYRPGIVHRLDKDTSGIIIVAKNSTSLAFLAAQFQARTARKHYLALVRGRPNPAEGRIEGFLARSASDRKLFAISQASGKRALTLYRTQESFPGYSLVSLFPRTGRTHQLRVHMKSINCPILGDPMYGKTDTRFASASLMLHAFRLKIILPGETEARVFTAPPPPRFQIIIDELRS